MARKKYFISLALLSMSLSGVALANDNQKSQRFEADVSQAQDITIDIPAGQVLVVGSAGSKLLAEVTATCKQGKKTNPDDCRALLKELDWSKKIGTSIELGLSPAKVTRYDDVQLEVRVSVPQDKNLNLNLAAGELRVEGTSGCVNASINAGQLSLKLKESDLASVDLKAKVGEAKLTNSKGEVRLGERSFLVGANLHWDGSGKCQAKGDVMAGEVHLTLY